MNPKLKLFSTLLLLPAIILLISCYPNQPEEKAGINVQSTGADFEKYWYNGEAELSSYELEQARYAEIHQGSAALIFVSEDFSPEEYTKANVGEKNVVPILKMNFDKKFLTGVYPYSMMSSVYSPVDISVDPYPMKIVSSSQEWCGMTYTQFEHRNGKYQYFDHSYFPGEGDEKGEFRESWLEDGIWTMIRIAPDKLPVGEIKMMPSAFYLRLRHRNNEPVNAIAKLEQGDVENVYSIEYPSLNRKLDIVFEKKFPFLINGWSETYESGFGDEKTVLTTTGKRKKTIKLDYWNKHKNSDMKYREELGL